MRRVALAGSIEDRTRFESSTFRVEKRWDRWSLTTSLSADVEPSAFGVLWRRETASVRIAQTV